MHVCEPQSSKTPSNVFQCCNGRHCDEKSIPVRFLLPILFYSTITAVASPQDCSLYRTITSSSQYKGLWRRIFVFGEKYFETEIFCCKFPILLKNIRQKMKILFLKIAKNHHNCLQYERCLRFSTFIFWTSPNLTNCSYGWFPPEQHHKIEKKTLLWPH
jgi:hypothetical protein